MKQRIRTIGLAFVAMCAICAVAASAATAAEFHSEGKETVLTGSQVEPNIFKVSAGTIKCSIAKFAGVTSATSTTQATVSVTPTYEECTLAGAAATVKMNGCTYEFLAPGVVEVPTKYSGNVSIICPGAAKIEVIAPTCTVTVKAVASLGTVDYHNTGVEAKRDIDVTATVKNVPHTQHGTKCLGNGGAAEKEFTNGEYTGTVTVTGEHGSSPTTQTGIWIA